VLARGGEWLDARSGTTGSGVENVPIHRLNSTLLTTTLTTIIFIITATSGSAKHIRRVEQGVESFF
jgi:hypothetical protein